MKERARRRGAGPCQVSDAATPGWRPGEDVAPEQVRGSMAEEEVGGRVLPGLEAPLGAAIYSTDLSGPARAGAGGPPQDAARPLHAAKPDTGDESFEKPSPTRVDTDGAIMI